MQQVINFSFYLKYFKLVILIVNSVDYIIKSEQILLPV